MRKGWYDCSGVPKAGGDRIKTVSSTNELTTRQTQRLLHDTKQPPNHNISQPKHKEQDKPTTLGLTIGRPGSVVAQTQNKKNDQTSPKTKRGFGQETGTGCHSEAKQKQRQKQNKNEPQACVERNKGSTATRGVRPTSSITSAGECQEASRSFHARNQSVLCGEEMYCPNGQGKGPGSVRAQKRCGGAVRTQGADDGRPRTWEYGACSRIRSGYIAKDG